MTDKEKKAILVVEDDPDISQSLVEMLEIIGYEVVGVAASAEEALLQLQEILPDLVLLDIQLSGKMDGIELAQALRDYHGLAYLFTSAYADDDTIERAKKQSPYGYLVKPYSLKELKASIEMALGQHEKNTESQKPQSYPEQLFLKVESRLIRLKVSDILFAEAQGDYVRIFIQKDEKITVYSPLKKLYDKLDPERFMQVHRSYLVNLAAIDGMEDTSLMIGKHSVPVSRKMRPVLLQRLPTL